MEFFPTELTALPVAQVALIGPEDICHILSNRLNAHVTRRLPLFHVWPATLAAWTELWTNTLPLYAIKPVCHDGTAVGLDGESAAYEPGDNHGSPETVGIPYQSQETCPTTGINSPESSVFSALSFLPLSWFRSLVFCIPAVVIAVLDFRGYPTTPPQLWSSAQAEKAQSLKTSASQAVLQVRKSLIDYCIRLRKEDSNQAPLSGCVKTFPKILFVVVFTTATDEELESTSFNSTPESDELPSLYAKSVDISTLAEEIGVCTRGVSYGQRSNLHLAQGATSPTADASVVENPVPFYGDTAGIDESTDIAISLTGMRVHQIASFADIIHQQCLGFFQQETKELRNSINDGSLSGWDVRNSRSYVAEESALTPLTDLVSSSDLMILRHLQLSRLAEYLNNPRKCLQNYIDCWEVLVTRPFGSPGDLHIETILLCLLVSLRMMQLYVLFDDAQKALYHFKAHKTLCLQKFSAMSSSSHQWLLILCLGISHLFAAQLLNEKLILLRRDKGFLLSPPGPPPSEPQNGEPKPLQQRPSFYSGTVLENDPLVVDTEENMRLSSYDRLTQAPRLSPMGLLGALGALMNATKRLGNFVDSFRVANNQDTVAHRDAWIMFTSFSHYLEGLKLLRLSGCLKQNYPFATSDARRETAPIFFSEMPTSAALSTPTKIPGLQWNTFCIRDFSGVEAFRRSIEIVAQAFYSFADVAYKALRHFALLILYCANILCDVGLYTDALCLYCFLMAVYHADPSLTVQVVEATTSNSENCTEKHLTFVKKDSFAPHKTFLYYCTTNRQPHSPDQDAGVADCPTTFLPIIRCRSSVLSVLVAARALVCLCFRSIVQPFRDLCALADVPPTATKPPSDSSLTASFSAAFTAVQGPQLLRNMASLLHLWHAEPDSENSFEAFNSEVAMSTNSSDLAVVAAYILTAEISSNPEVAYRSSARISADDIPAFFSQLLALAQQLLELYRTTPAWPFPHASLDEDLRLFVPTLYICARAFPEDCDRSLVLRFSVYHRQERPLRIRGLRFIEHTRRLDIFHFGAGNALSDVGASDTQSGKNSPTLHWEQRSVSENRWLPLSSSESAIRIVDATGWLMPDGVITVDPGALLSFHLRIPTPENAEEHWLPGCVALQTINLLCADFSNPTIFTWLTPRCLLPDKNADNPGTAFSLVSSETLESYKKDLSPVLYITSTEAADLSTPFGGAASSLALPFGKRADHILNDTATLMSIRVLPETSQSLWSLDPPMFPLLDPTAPRCSLQQQLMPDGCHSEPARSGTRKKNMALNVHTSSSYYAGGWLPLPSILLFHKDQWDPQFRAALSHSTRPFNRPCEKPSLWVAGSGNHEEAAEDSDTEVAVAPIGLQLAWATVMQRPPLQLLNTCSGGLLSLQRHTLLICSQILDPYVHITLSLDSRSTKPLCNTGTLITLRVTYCPEFLGDPALALTARLMVLTDLAENHAACSVVANSPVTATSVMFSIPNDASPALVFCFKQDTTVAAAKRTELCRLKNRGPPLELPLSTPTASNNFPSIGLPPSAVEEIVRAFCTKANSLNASHSYFSNNVNPDALSCLPLYYWIHSPANLQNDDPISLSHHRFSQKYKSLGVETRQIGVPLLIQFGQSGLYNVSAKLELTRDSDFLGLVAQEIQVEVVDPLHTDIRRVSSDRSLLLLTVRNITENDLWLRHLFLRTTSTATDCDEQCDEPPVCDLLADTAPFLSTTTTTPQIKLIAKRGTWKHLFSLKAPQISAFIEKQQGRLFIIDVMYELDCPASSTQNVSEKQTTPSVLGTALSNAGHSSLPQLCFFRIPIPPHFLQHALEKLSLHSDLPVRITCQHPATAGLRQPFFLKYTVFNLRDIPQVFVCTLTPNTRTAGSFSPLQSLETHGLGDATGNTKAVHTISDTPLFFIEGRLKATLLIAPHAHHEMTWTLLPLEQGVVQLPRYTVQHELYHPPTLVPNKTLSGSGLSPDFSFTESLTALLRSPVVTSSSNLPKVAPDAQALHNIPFSENEAGLESPNVAVIGPVQENGNKLGSRITAAAPEYINIVIENQ